MTMWPAAGDASRALSTASPAAMRSTVFVPRNNSSNSSRCGRSLVDAASRLSCLAERDVGGQARDEGLEGGEVSVQVRSSIERPGESAATSAR